MTKIICVLAANFHLPASNINHRELPAGYSIQGTWDCSGCVLNGTSAFFYRKSASDTSSKFIAVNGILRFPNPQCIGLVVTIGVLEGRGVAGLGPPGKNI